MSVHEYDENLRPDTDFVPGDISYLVEGNNCRLLDGRRTTGYIEKYFEESAMYRWRITKYEDKGEYWDLPAENIKRFQFEKNADRLKKNKTNMIQKKINKFNKYIQITAQKKDEVATEEKIIKKQNSIEEWLKANSQFIINTGSLDFSENTGPKTLADDLKSYMKDNELENMEKKTAELMVLNPNSGEWIKGMKIVLAEMGLVSYNGKMPRTKDIFAGAGSKERRRKYLINRLAFIRAYFAVLDIKEIVLYRGMTTEKDWQENSRTFLPCTFSLGVAKAFSNFDRNSKYKNSYLMKMTWPVDKLFMTYLETEAMNKQYKEAEALVMFDDKICI